MKNNILLNIYLFNIYFALKIKAMMKLNIYAYHRILLPDKEYFLMNF